MTSQSVTLRNHVFQNGILACIVIATRTVKAFIRKAAGSKWRLLLTIAVGTLLAFVALKLMALLGAAFDISFLRDVGSNAGPGAAAGAAGAGAAGGAAGSGGYPPPPLPAPAPTPTPASPPPPPPPPWWYPPAGPPGPDGSPPRRIDNPNPGWGGSALGIWFSRTVQDAAGTSDTTTKANAIGKSIHGSKM
jgi:hypothetical protein